MSELTKENFEKYASLKAQKVVLEDELSSLSKEIIGEMGELDKVEATGVGTFTVTSKKKWTYSGDLQDSEKRLKTSKKEEEADGTATFEDGAPYIIFKEK